MARHMPKVAASWVSGQYDNDRSVSRAAIESFRRVFSSEEKIKNVWRLYQVPILEYATDVVVKETANTLSDERTTSPDDSSAKYSRVVATSLVMVTKLIESTSRADIEKGQILLNDFLNEEKLWQFASNGDAFVRRTLYRLLGTILASYKATLNPSTISGSVLLSGLNTTQSGSSFDYAKVLALLSVELPDAWTTYYPGSGKKSATSRLCHFLKKGSQGGPPDFWSQIAVLISNLPSSLLVNFTEKESNKNGESQKESPSWILNALQEGLNNKDESHANRFAAWSAYLTASDITLASTPDADTRRQIVIYSILPILAQYIRPSSENYRWAIAGAQGQEVCIRACNQAILRDPNAFEEECNVLSHAIIEDIKISLPEQAKDYAKSQESLSAESERWYCLQAALLEGNRQKYSAMVRNSVSPEVKSAISVLQARNGKPYGVAATLEFSIQRLPEIVLGDEGCKAEILGFVNGDLPGLLLSPSAKYLIRILNHLDGSCDVSRSYDKCIHILAEAPQSASKSIALQSLISSPRLAPNESLFAMIISILSQAMKDDDPMSWNVVMAAISNPLAPNSFADELLGNMIEGLSIDSEKVTGLSGLEMATKQNLGKVTDFARSPQGSSMLSKLLLLADWPDDGIAQRARYTSTTIEKALVAQGGTGQAANALIGIVNKGLDTAEGSVLSYVDHCPRMFNGSHNRSPGPMHLSPRHRRCSRTRLRATCQQWSKSCCLVSCNGVLHSRRSLPVFQTHH